MKPFKPGEKVQWNWMGRIIHGEVEEVFVKPVTKVIKGKNIKRNGSLEKPAYLVKSAAGNLALKLQTELSLPAVEKYPHRPKPKMFDDT